MSELLIFFKEYWFELIVPLILVGGAIFFYNKQDLQGRRNFKKWIPVIVATCLLIVIRKLWDNTLIHWKCWDIWFIIFISFYTLFLMFGYREKYLTEGFVVADGCPVACFSTEPVVKGKYTIFNAGSSNKSWREENGDFVLVVPTKCIRWIGNTAVCNVQVTRRDLRNGLPYLLPDSVSDYILSDKKLNSNCIYMGMFDRRTLLYGKPFDVDIFHETHQMTYKDFQEEFAIINYRLNITKEHAFGIDREIEDRVQHQKRVKNASLGNNQFKIDKYRETGDA